MAGIGRPISFRAGSGASGSGTAGSGSSCRLSIRFSPELDSKGSLRLRVQPEIRVHRGEGIETRQYVAGLRDDGPFLVRGLLKEQDDRQVLEQLYPGHSWNSRRLVILVTSSGATSPTTAALDHTHRRR